MAPARRSIGQVLATVKNDFPDITISKIRFLETEGLLAPERAPSGYRKYAQVDIDRLLFILTMQRDHYLPLKVIREHLEIMDAGGEPPTLDQPAPAPTVRAEHEPQPEPARRPEPRPGQASGPVRLTRRELLQHSGLADSVLLDLERLQLVSHRRGASHYGREALVICQVAKKFEDYGMDVRHLRAIKQAAEREAGLVEQAIAPYVRRRNRANDAASEVTRLVLHAHAAMMHTLLER